MLFRSLTEAEIKTSVVLDKWTTSIRTGIDRELQRLIQQLARRVMELEDRYAAPLPQVDRKVETLSARV